jgi:signal transduction histidine kinase
MSQPATLLLLAEDEETLTTVRQSLPSMFLAYQASTAEAAQQQLEGNVPVCLVLAGSWAALEPARLAEALGLAELALPPLVAVQEDEQQGNPAGAVRLSLASLTAEALRLAVEYAIERQQLQRLLGAQQTAREAAEATLHQRDAELAHALHELRTPLTSISGQAQLLQRRLTQEYTLSERNQRALHVILEQAQRLSQLLQAMQPEKRST